MPSLTPAHRLLAASLICVAGGAAAVALALSQPFLGLTLHADFEKGEVVVTDAVGPAAAVAPGARLVSVGTGLPALAPSDLIEEPDYFDRYDQMADFFARQGQLAAALRVRAWRAALVAA